METQQSISEWANETFGPAGIATTVANANGVFSGHPYLAYWLYAVAGGLILAAIAGSIFDADRARQKRHAAVRDIILSRGAPSKGDMMHDGMTDSDATKAIKELHRNGEIIPSEDVGGRTLWRFRIHPHITSAISGETKKSQ